MASTPQLRGTYQMANRWSKDIDTSELQYLEREQDSIEHEMDRLEDAISNLEARSRLLRSVYEYNDEKGKRLAAEAQEAFAPLGMDGYQL